MRDPSEIKASGTIDRVLDERQRRDDMMEASATSLCNISGIVPFVGARPSPPECRQASHDSLSLLSIIKLLYVRLPRIYYTSLSLFTRTGAPRNLFTQGTGDENSSFHGRFPSRLQLLLLLQKHLTPPRCPR